MYGVSLTEDIHKRLKSEKELKGALGLSTEAADDDCPEFEFDIDQIRAVTKSPDNHKEVDDELEGLAEIIPDLKTRRTTKHRELHGVTHNIMTTESYEMPPQEDNSPPVDTPASPRPASPDDSTDARRLSIHSVDELLKRGESMVVHEGKARNGSKGPPAGMQDNSGNDEYDDDDSVGMAGSENVLEDHSDSKIPKEFMNMSSGQSISTATQTLQQSDRMPLYLPTFKPATGCTNASDFIVRCFVARLRAGITVVKHGRSRWCKSRLRVLHIHPDGRSLSWKPAEGEPSSSKRPPKLDLSTCLEVRHAWSPDPQNPMYTGTPILRQKCEAANAHKSFALIFKARTVDITAVTADQCKVLMEGFSALCFRLQVAQLAKARPMPEEDGVSTTASATLTNTSKK